MKLILPFIGNIKQLYHLTVIEGTERNALSKRVDSFRDLWFQVSHWYIYHNL